MIATEPDSDGRFAVVSFTSLKGAKDQTVIIRAGEHPFVRWDTCAAYGLAEITAQRWLEQSLSEGRAELREDVSSQLLVLLVDGFLASEFTKERVREFVRKLRQGSRGQ